MNKKIFLLSLVISLFLAFSSVNAWKDCDNYWNCTYCKVSVPTHCEPIDMNLCEQEPDDPDCKEYTNDHNTPINNDCSPTTPWCAPADNTNSSSSNNNPSNTSNEKPAYLYIKYRDLAWRDIYNVPTYKWKDSEKVDLSKYKKDLTTFKFVKYKPESGTITLKWWKSLSAFIIYEKRITQNSNPNSSYHQNLDKIKADTHKVDKVDHSNSDYHKNIKDKEDKTEIIYEKRKHIPWDKERIKVMKKNIDKFLKKKRITWKNRVIILNKIEKTLYDMIIKEKNKKMKELYLLLIEAIKQSKG